MLLRVTGINLILFITALGNLRSSVMACKQSENWDAKCDKVLLLLTLSGKYKFIFIFSSCRVLYFLHATMKWSGIEATRR